MTPRICCTLRTGYTTGACAAAAAKAAALALIGQRAVKRVEIDLPGGEKAVFAVKDCAFDGESAECSVIKDAGDDPDVTDGIEIRATVSRQEGAGINIEGGEGVGVVTKPGLEIAVGEAAINSVPRRMIAQSVADAAGKIPGGGLRVVISVPQGKNRAAKTLNRRLGIVGGISIIGTSGIVIPYSVEAYTACISQALAVAAAAGCRKVVLTTGRRSEKYAQAELALPDECFIQAGDFIGHSLRESVRKGLAEAVIWGMIGKVSKLAAGHLYTNVSDSRVDIAFLAGVAAGCGLPQETVRALGAAVTANHLRRMLPPEHKRQFCDRLCLLAVQRCRDSVAGKLGVECIMTDPEGGILGRANAGE